MKRLDLEGGARRDEGRQDPPSVRGKLVYLSIPGCLGRRRQAGQRGRRRRRRNHNIKIHGGKKP
jgi:hypothetical protein